MITKSLEIAVLKLPAEERGRLAAAILSSLEGNDSAGLDEVWVDEAERRYRRVSVGAYFYDAGEKGHLDSPGCAPPMNAAFLEEARAEMVEAAKFYDQQQAE